MARPKYTVTADDVTHVKSYLQPRLRTYDVALADEVSYRDVEKEFLEATSESRKEKRAVLLNAWCEQYLSSAEWDKLKLAVRKRRERRVRTDLKTVTITARAFQFLSKLAARDNVTYSEVLERYLLKVLNSKRR